MGSVSLAMLTGKVVTPECLGFYMITNKRDRMKALQAANADTSEYWAGSAGNLSWQARARNAAIARRRAIARINAENERAVKLQLKKLDELALHEAECAVDSQTFWDQMFGIDPTTPPEKIRREEFKKIYGESIEDVFRTEAECLERRLNWLEFEASQSQSPKKSP